MEKNFTGDLKIFNIFRVKRKNPNWNKTSEFTLLESPPWVNIIPVTKNNTIVLVEQYRHGIDDITLEIPGGLVEPGEMPHIAACRECAEETGYFSESEALLLGISLPNPAFLNNSCHSYVWFGCEKRGRQQLDGNEDINVLEVPAKEINDLIIRGKISHSLVLTAFFYYGLKYGSL